MTEIERILEHLTNEITDLKMALAEQDRRMRNMIRPARVTKTKRGESKVSAAYDLDDDGNEVETHDIDWGTPSAGRIKISNPPNQDEQGFIFSPNGDIDESSVFMPMSMWSDKNKDPHDKDGEMKTTIDDDHTDLMTKEKREMSVKHLVVKADRVDFGKRG